MAAPKKYHSTPKGLMKWAEHELEHVGRIAGVENTNLQYSYALSTVNGMAHLKDALYEAVMDPAFEQHKEALKRTHDKVVRVMKRLIEDYDVNLNTIRAFNTRKVLSNLSYLNKNGGNKTRSAARKNRKTRRRN